MREGGFIDDAGEFDAAFFGISPREALAMDPQQRLLLEVCWEALEDAGIDPRRCGAVATGVFAGVMHHDYAYGVGSAALARGLEGIWLTGSAGSVAPGGSPTRWGWRAPRSRSTRRAPPRWWRCTCACQALRPGECSLALAGGVT